MEQRQAIDWEQLLDIIDKENTRPSCEGWIRDEFLRDLPIPHQAIDMVPDLAPWTWTEPQPQPQPQPDLKRKRKRMPQAEPQPKIASKPQSESQPRPYSYMDWMRTTSSEKPVHECLCKWCTCWRMLTGHKCQYCGAKMNTSVEAFKRHVATHSKITPTPCSWFNCKLTYIKETSLQVHIEVQHMRKNPFDCKQCGVHCMTVYAALNHCL